MFLTSRAQSRALAAALFLLMLAPSASLAWRYRSMPQFGLHHDDALYFVSAKAVADGLGYRIESMPEQPFQTKYPPAYPLLLSAVWMLKPDFPQNLPLAALLSWLMLPAYVLLARKVFSGYGFGFVAGLFLCFAITLNVVSMMLAMSLMSDLLFCVALLSVIVLAERWGEAEQPWWIYIFLGLMAGFAYLIRSVAAPLLISVPLCYWMRGRRGAAGLFIGGMLPAMIGWQVWVKLHQPAGTDAFTLYYTNYLGFYIRYVDRADIPALLRTNIEAYWKGLGQLLLFNIDDSFLSTQLARVTTIAAILGAVRLVRRTGRVQYGVYAIGLSIMLLLWNFAPSPRFLFPLFVFFAGGLFTELQHVWKLIRLNRIKPKRPDRIAAYVVAGLLFCYFFAWAKFTWDGAIDLLPGVLNAREELLAKTVPVYEWIRKSTPRDATFLAYDDAVLYLYSGRRGLSPPILTHLLIRDDAAGVLTYLNSLPQMAKDRGLTHILLTDVDFYRDFHANGTKALRKAVDTSPLWQLEYSDQHARVYKLKPG
jgi:hypothetical protein